MSPWRTPKLLGTPISPNSNGVCLYYLGKDMVCYLYEGKRMAVGGKNIVPKRVCPPSSVGLINDVVRTLM